MTHYKVLTHDRRPAIRLGDPLYERLPAELPEVEVDESSADCGRGWNSVTDLAAGFRITGLWPAGRPSTVLVVEPNGTVVTRGDKTRSSGMTLLREATELEVVTGIDRLCEPFGEHASAMTDETLTWRFALSRPEHDPEAVDAGLRAALEARELPWTLRRFDDARAAWAAWDAWDARDARAAWDARDAWDAWDALTWRYAVAMGRIDGDSDRLTVGIRDAYRHGLAVVLPTGPAEFGWAMIAR